MDELGAEETFGLVMTAEHLWISCVAVLRTRIADICMDYGLERIQFSAFFGKLNRNRRQELALKLQNELGDETGRIRIIPVCEQDLKDMWVLDQYRRDADRLKAEAEARDRPKPRLKVLGVEGDQ